MTTTRRRYTRIELELNSEVVLSNGDVFRAQTSNVSFGGAFLKQIDKFSLQEGEIFQLSLSVEDRMSETDTLLSSIVFESKAVHFANNGIGVQFLSIGQEDYNRFVKLMASRCENIDQLLEEQEENPHLIVHQA